MSIITLAKTASIGGVFVIGSAYYFKNRIQDGLRSSEYYKKSLRILREHRGIAYLMGEPIREGNLDLGDNTNNFCTGTVAQFQVPVKGTKKTGILYMWASRIEVGGEWNVDRLELGLKDEPGKRILIIGAKDE